ncbi:hypothetical protein [Pseudoroseomonas sp. WGS1072]|uniref:hypothetical protein n=1 Tax=Roseomonas sp. WGS1072 TaxID=3366816 RepID=UPI003BF41EFF
MNAPVNIRKRAEIELTIDKMIQAGEGFRAPLLRAAADGLIAVTISTRGSPVPANLLKAKKATCVLLADDHPLATGPDRWEQAKTLLRWSEMVILHAAGGQDRHYILAAMLTMISGRVVLVEMQGQHHDAWRALALTMMDGRRILSIVVPPGDVHPRPGAPEGVTIQ